MKRFTETAKWDDKWFRSLQPMSKLLFFYLIDRCDNAGFWEVDMEDAAFRTGLDHRALEGAMKGLQRGFLQADGWLWLRNFLKHQKNDELNPRNLAHAQIIGLIEKQLERFSDFPEIASLVAPTLAPIKGPPSPIGIGKGKGSGQEGEPERKPTDRMKDAMRAVGKLYGQPDRQWQSAEWHTLRSHLEILTEENLRALSQFYAKERKENRTKYLGDMRTFLREPQAMLDRAIMAGFTPKKVTQAIPGALSAHEPSIELRPLTDEERDRRRSELHRLRGTISPTTTNPPLNENTEAGNQ